ncbi:hypothetical protein GCM10022234_23340 [Aeromicrobium panaciterrae]|uniref:hypothetical protein n=1 Tax=Aeromicrobium panaciterrae TaxID=363861 RepID=UPI0031DC0C9A
MRLRLAALVGALFITSSCVAASPDADTYGDAAASSLGTAVSEVATVRTLLELLDSGDIPRPAVVAQLRYSEDALTKASQGLGSLNPPPEQDALSDESGRLLDEAGSLLQEARIAVHRGEKAEYRTIVKDLDDLGARLEKLEASAS